MIDDRCQATGATRGVARSPAPPKTCALLMPVWGAAFVRQFLDFCLPTLLAAGNIPALARTLPTRFVLLTRSRDVPAIAEHPAWQHLAKYCERNVQTIDDLVVEGNHHATITLAYTRALRTSGEAMRDTVFLFLVADYLVADGSLPTVLKRIQAGASGVLAGNLQIVADAAVPLLREATARLEMRTFAASATANELGGHASASDQCRQRRQCLLPPPGRHQPSLLVRRQKYLDRPVLSAAHDWNPS